MGVRIGRVNSVDKEKRQVRVFYEDLAMMSGWLKVVKNPPFIPTQEENQKTEIASNNAADNFLPSHYHNIEISPWLPSVGDCVLCMYNDEFNCDGYVLGAL